MRSPRSMAQYPRSTRPAKRTFAPTAANDHRQNSLIEHRQKLTESRPVPVEVQNQVVVSLVAHGLAGNLGPDLLSGIPRVEEHGLRMLRIVRKLMERFQDKRARLTISVGKFQHHDPALLRVKPNTA